MLSGKSIGKSTLFSSSLFQPYRVGSTVGGPAFIVAYHTMACKCALFTFSLKDSSVRGKNCKEEAVFLALDVLCTKT